MMEQASYVLLKKPYSTLTAASSKERHEKKERERETQKKETTKLREKKAG